VEGLADVLSRQYTGFGVENTEEMHIRISLLNCFYVITDKFYCFF
jgi:hypothetical protein